MAVAREAVLFAYKFFLRREPESEDVIRFHMENANDEDALAEAMTHSEEYHRLMNQEPEEVLRSTSQYDKLAFEKMRTVHNGYAYLAPPDLAVSPVQLRRVMIVGSCLARIWLIGNNLGCPCDFVLTNNLRRLPDDPPHPAAEYDFQLVQIALRRVIPDGVLWHTSFFDIQDYEKAFEDAVDRLHHFLTLACEWNAKHKMLTFVSNFFVPQQNPVGRLMPRYDLRNPVYFIEKLNRALAKEVQTYENAFLLDVDAISAAFGKKHTQDDGINPITHNSVANDFGYNKDKERIEFIEPVFEHYDLCTDRFVAAVWNEILAMYRTILQQDMVKLIILDLDNTLWRGVIAEENEITPDTLEGWPTGLVEALCYIKKRGVMLAIVSKNDEGRIRDLWPKIMGGMLSLDDFAVVRINWRPKAENIEEILKMVNMLPRSAIFIDDNPVERAAVKMAFPDIRVLGTYPYYHKRILLWSPETQVQAITSESSRRTEMIHSQVGRETVRQRMSRDDFLATLDLKVSISRISSMTHPKFARAFELLNKTNQFNTTGRRWTREECDAGFSNGLEFHVFEVTDRFSEYGLVGCALVIGNRIDQFVMSCRVVGLDVENHVISAITAHLLESGESEVHAKLIRTDANFPCRDIFANCGFQENDNGWVKSKDQIRHDIIASRNLV